jgi:hypothetical protein
MGTIILNVAFIVELAFAIYCGVTKSNQRRVRNFMRIGALAAFILLALASVIRWSFRWYGLATLLLVWAALGALALIGRKNDSEDYKTRVIVRRAIRTVLLIVLALIPALIFPQYRPPEVTGTHPVATVNYTYTDPNRIETFTNTGENREVNVEFWYPKELSNNSTFVDLASNGYVVCSIDHPYHSLFTIDDKGHRAIINNAYLQEYMKAANGKYDAATNYKLNHEWMTLRIADIKFVLDTILSNVKNPSSGMVYQLIDPAKIGLMGHSLGGESAAQVARERYDIGAVVNLDADMAGEYVDFVNGKEVLNDTVYPVPILNILADDLVRLISVIPDAKEVIAEKHVTATAPNAYEVHLAGTNHFSVTDMPLISPFLVYMLNASVPNAGGQMTDPLSTIETMNDLVLKFFTAYLKGEGTFSTAGTN